MFFFLWELYPVSPFYACSRPVAFLAHPLFRPVSLSRAHLIRKANPWFLCVVLTTFYSDPPRLNRLSPSLVFFLPKAASDFLIPFFFSSGMEMFSVMVLNFYLRSAPILLSIFILVLSMLNTLPFKSFITLEYYYNVVRD